jgi:hypothetical protein
MVPPMARSLARRGLLALALVTLGVAAAGTWVTVMALGWPDQARLAPPDPAAGRHFQGVLAQLLLRDTGLSTRQDPLALTVADVNAFLSGHVEVRNPPVWPVQVWIDGDGVGAGGVTTLGRLVSAGVSPRLARALPLSVGDCPLWVAASGEIVVREGQAEFVARSAWIGRQPVPVAVLWRLLGGRPSALTWRMARVVERVDVEPGRLLIHTRRPGPRGGSPG